MENDKDSARVAIETPNETPIKTVAADTHEPIPHDEWIGTLVFAAILTLFGVFWVWASSDLPNRQQTAYLSQGFLPITAGILLAGLSALLFLSTWLTKSRPSEELDRARLFDPRGEALAAAIFAALLAYILILPHVHYLISTFALMAVGLVLSGEPLRPRLIVIAAVMAGLFFGLFIYALQLPLPGSRYG
jgi:hypothetical protein